MVTLTFFFLIIRNKFCNSVLKSKITKIDKIRKTTQRTFTVDNKKMYNIGSKSSMNDLSERLNENKYLVNNDRTIVIDIHIVLIHKHILNVLLHASYFQKAHKTFIKREKEYG